MHISKEFTITPGYIRTYINLISQENTIRLLYVHFLAMFTIMITVRGFIRPVFCFQIFTMVILKCVSYVCTIFDFYDWFTY